MLTPECPTLYSMPAEPVFMPTEAAERQRKKASGANDEILQEQMDGDCRIADSNRRIGGFQAAKQSNATVPYGEGPAGRYTERGAGHRHHQRRYHGAGGFPGFRHDPDALCRL